MYILPKLLLHQPSLTSQPSFPHPLPCLLVFTQPTGGGESSLMPTHLYTYKVKYISCMHLFKPDANNPLLFPHPPLPLSLCFMLPKQHKREKRREKQRNSITHT